MPETNPTNDWRLVDSFTVAIHPNATRGQLSVNQTNLAAWSAVLSSIGVTTYTNDAKSSNGIAAIDVLTQPAANDWPISQIVQSINAYRDPTNLPLGQFFKVGQILGVPALTGQSPFLTQPYLSKQADDWETKKNLITDLDYERIPDQVLSLLKVGDLRFVVYAWGQSLKPAQNLPGFPSIITAGQNAGMCVNYQITGEMAARAVIRVDFEKMPDPTDPANAINPAAARSGRGRWVPDYRRPHAVVESFNILPPN
jgi:hypothetical protein